MRNGILLNRRFRIGVVGERNYGTSVYQRNLGIGFGRVETHWTFRSGKILRNLRKEDYMRQYPRMVAFSNQSFGRIKRPISVKCTEVTRHFTLLVHYNPKHHPWHFDLEETFFFRTTLSKVKIVLYPQAHLS